MTDVKKVADEADTICILHPTVLLNACTFTQAIEN